jgi:hypothetical protein
MFMLPPKPEKAEGFEDVFWTSWRRVLTTQMGFVADPVTIPAVAAAVRWTKEFSTPVWCVGE